MHIINVTRMTTIAEKAVEAKTFLSRLIGLTGRRSLGAGEALVLSSCRSIHMLFMKFAIDAVFVDANNRVVGLVEGIKPFRLSPVFFRASYCIEAPCGTIDTSKTSLDDLIEFRN